VFGAVVSCVGLVLTGCSQGSGYTTQTAESLQSSVLGITSSASSRDYAGALLQLTRLEQADNAALSAGSITRTRHDTILATIVQVRADLVSLQGAARPVDTPTPQPTHQQKDGGDGNGNGNGGD
jgi:hypothetical protein